MFIFKNISYLEFENFWRMEYPKRKHFKFQDEEHEKRQGSKEERGTINVTKAQQAPRQPNIQPGSRKTLPLLLSRETEKLIEEQICANHRHKFYSNSRSFEETQRTFQKAINCLMIRKHDFSLIFHVEKTSMMKLYYLLKCYCAQEKLPIDYMIA